MKVQHYIGGCTMKSVVKVTIRILCGQALSFLMSLTGVSTTFLVNNNNSFPLLQSITAYLFIFIVYFPLYLYMRYKYRGTTFSNFQFMHRWWKYAILALIDLEANFVVVTAYQYTDMMSIQLLDCFTIPAVLVLSFLILKMRFAVTHVVGCLIAIGGLILLIFLDADGVSREGSRGNELKGDLLCLLSSILYATSNVLTEWIIKIPKAPSVPLERTSIPCHPTENRDAVPDQMEDRKSADEHSTREPMACYSGVEEELPKDVVGAPVYISLIENVAIMSGFALVFATIQFFAVEWKTFSTRGEWRGEDWLFQIVFGLTMLCIYTGMPALFIMTSAAFANISLLSADIYAIIWNTAIFHIYPTAMFALAYVIIVGGILLYDLTDVVSFPCCARWNYPCGRASSGDERAQDDREPVSEVEGKECQKD